MRGSYPLDTADVKIFLNEKNPTTHFTMDNHCDQKAGNNKKDINTKKAARQPVFSIWKMTTDRTATARNVSISGR